MEIYVIQNNCGKPIAFELPPSTIHACISLDLSAHSTLAVWRKEGLKEAQVFNQFMMNCWKDWEKWIGNDRGLSTSGNEAQDIRKMMIRNGKQKWDKLSIDCFSEWKKEWKEREKKGWNRLASLLKRRGGDKEIQDWVNEVMGFLEENIADSD